MLSVNSRVTYSEEVVDSGFLKRSSVRWIRQVKYFSMAALGGLVRAGRMGGGKLRHRAFALGPWRGNRP